MCQKEAWQTSYERDLGPKTEERVKGMRPVGRAIVSVLATLWTADDRAQTMTPARDGLAAKFLRYVELME